MKRLNYRTIKSNRILFYGKVLVCKDLQHGELDGQRCVFIPYERREDGLTCLWGTAALQHTLSQLDWNDRWARNYENYDDIDPDRKAKEAAAWDANDAILAPDGYFRWYFWRHETANG